MPICFKLLVHCVFWPLARRLHCRQPSAIKIAMIVITTNNSTKVNPLAVRRNPDARKAEQPDPLMANPFPDDETRKKRL